MTPGEAYLNQDGYVNIDLRYDLFRAPLDSCYLFLILGRHGLDRFAIHSNPLNEDAGGWVGRGVCQDDDGA